MNNSKFAIESIPLSLEEAPDTSDQLKNHEQKLVNTIAALREVQATKGWSTLKRELFDELPATIERNISQEAKKLNPDTMKLNRLSGELKWAGRFSDLKKYEDELRVELQNVRKQLYG